MSAVVVFCTVPSPEVAEQLARALVEERLAACVNVVPGLRSFYRWEGAVQDDAELLLIIKTDQGRLAALYQRIPELHPYSVPEGIGWAVGSGLQPYLDWVHGSTEPAD